MASSSHLFSTGQPRMCCTFRALQHALLFVLLLLLLMMMLRLLSCRSLA
jgi:hypothetical protein